MATSDAAHVVPPRTAAAPAGLRRTAPGGLPPGPDAPGIVQNVRFVLRPFAFLDECARRYGACFTVRLLGQPPTVSFSDPRAIEDIFTAPPDVLVAGEASAPFLGSLLGWSSILVLDGPRHLRERRLMLPPFHGERMHAYGAAMQEATDRAIDAWPRGRPFPIHPELQRIALEVIIRAVFGLEQGTRHARLRAHLERILALANSAAAAALAIPALRVDWGRLTPWGRFLRDREAFRAILQDEIARRRGEDAGTPRSDILSMLMAARDERGEGMSDGELFDEMFTLLMAGHETTASALAWAFHHVLGRPDVLQRLGAALEPAGGGGPVEAGAAVRLEYLDAVLQESQRLTPTLTNTIRLVRTPVRIGGLDLPAGIAVSPSMYLTHRRPDLWPEPERFDPERFVGRRPEPYTFFPFGGGIRRCLGAAFASYEMKVVLARILSRVRLRLAPGYRMRPLLRAVAVAPSNGVPVVAEPR